MVSRQPSHGGSQATHHRTARIDSRSRRRGLCYRCSLPAKIRRVSAGGVCQGTSVKADVSETITAGDGETSDRANARLLAPDGYHVRPLFSTRVASIRELLSLRFRTSGLEADFSRYCLPISLFQGRLAFCMACVFLVGDYVADSIFYGLTTSPANLLRIYVVAPVFFCFFLASYLPTIKRRYELYVTIFYSVVASFLFYILYLLDIAGGNGISNTAGF